MENETTYVYQICISRTIKISSNQHIGLLRFLFTENSLKIKKGLELVPRPHFSYNFFINFFWWMLHKLGKFHDHTVFTSQVIPYNMFRVSCLCFDDAMTFKYLESWNLIISRTKRAFEMKHFSLFQKCCLLDVKNKLATM